MLDSLLSELSKEELSLLDRAFYMAVWKTRQPLCECCQAPLYEPRLYMFHHILEKRKKKFSHEDYTMYRHCHWNIMLLCWQCHDAYERNPDTKPAIVQVKDMLLYIIGQPHQWDHDDIWLLDNVVDIGIIDQLFANHPINYS